MSDEIKYASPDAPRPRPHKRAQRSPGSGKRLDDCENVWDERKDRLTTGEISELKTLKKARKLIRRWENGDEDVTIADIFSLIVNRPVR